MNKIECSAGGTHSLWFMSFLVIGLPSSSRRESHTEVTLKLWKEGFSINDGTVREYADPANREFLDSVRRG